MPRMADVAAAAAAQEAGAAHGHKKRRLSLPNWRRAQPGEPPSTLSVGQGWLGVLLGFVAGVGTGAVVAVFTLRGGSQRG
jgi:hypothetical protein